MSHYENVISAILHGEVIPFLGAGVNIFGRQEQEVYMPGQYLPSARELAAYLAVQYDYKSDDKTNLLRVSQYATVMRGAGSLYNRLGEVFDADYPMNVLHKFFARLPRILKRKGCVRPYQLIVTTNYDDVLETAFRRAKEPFDVVYYMARKPHQGKFRHIPHETSPRDSILIDDPNTYNQLPFKGPTPQRTVILKIHGAVDRVSDRVNRKPDELQDSFVITEDDYINYLAQTDISKLLPVQLKSKLTNSGFLFLGYGLRDWNLRVIMNRIWGEQKLDFASWAIQLKAEELDKKFWSIRKVDLIETRLETYIIELFRRLIRR